MTGTVKKKTDRGFGFISIPGNDKDLFFHSSALVGVSFDQLQEGATVSFEVDNGDNGRQSAKNVTLAEGGESAPAQEATPVETAETVDVAEEAAPAEEATPVEPAEEAVPADEEKA